MPRIAQIDIPDDFWQEMVHCHALRLAGEMIEQIEPAYPLIDTKKQREQLGLDFSDKLLLIEDRLDTLIQSQTGRTETEPEFGKILSAIFCFIDQVTFDTLFNLPHLRALIDQKLKTTEEQAISSF